MNMLDVVRYKSAVQMAVTLCSAYGILICHFMPKCYIILFKSEHNTREAFKRGSLEFRCLVHVRPRVDWRRAGLDRLDSAFTIESAIKNI